MLSSLALTFSLALSSAAVFVAGRTMNATFVGASFLRREIDRRSALHQPDEYKDGPGQPVDNGDVPLEQLMGRSLTLNVFGQAQRLELSVLLDEVFSAESPAEAQGSILEIQSTAKVLSERITSLSRGLVRVPFLGGVACAIFIAALLQMHKTGLVQAGACLLGGLVSSFACTLLMRRARKGARVYRALTDLLQPSASMEETP